MITFTFLDKAIAGQQLPALFAILSSNMSVIAPTGNSYDEDYNAWHEGITKALEQDCRSIVLVMNDEQIIGYFQYNISEDIFKMEEIQIKLEWQREYRVFRELYGFVRQNLPDNLKYVEASANKKNEKSQNILRRLGLSVIGENTNNYLFRGTYQALRDWYNGEMGHVG